MLDGDIERACRAPCFVKVPFIDVVPIKPMKSGIDVADEMKSPRLIKTHLPIQLVPPSFWEKNVKVVYVARNAKDCMVSYFYFQKMSKGLPDPGTWNDYFSTFMSGQVPWGSWFDHVIGWWRERDKHQILYIFYEDMIEDPEREIRRMAKFLGKDLSEETLGKIKHHTSFQAMKDNPMTNFSILPAAAFDQSISAFMRKGKVGDWKNHFLVSQCAVFDAEYKKRMEGVDLAFRDLLMDPEMMEQLEKALEKASFSMGQIEGIPLPKDTCDSWDIIYNFQARQDDILVSTYPKAGTTWAQEILDLIMLDGDIERACRAPCFVKVPFIDLVPVKPIKSGIDVADEMKSPRLIKTHLPIQLVPPSFWEKNVKVVYVARNAKDCMVSYFYFQKMNKGLPDPGTWNEYFSTFMSGQVPWGSWFDHVIDWWRARDKHQILYIFYEDMIEDPEREIRRMATFLGKDLSEETLGKIKHHTSFQAMKDNPMTNFSVLPPSVFDQSISAFMRKGKVGDWKNHFLVSQCAVFDEEYKKRMEGVDLTFRDLL